MQAVAVTPDGDTLRNPGHSWHYNKGLPSGSNQVDSEVG